MPKKHMWMPCVLLISLKRGVFLLLVSIFKESPSSIYLSPIMHFFDSSCFSSVPCLSFTLSLLSFYRGMWPQNPHILHALKFGCWILKYCPHICVSTVWNSLYSTVWVESVWFSAEPVMGFLGMFGFWKPSHLCYILISVHDEGPKSREIW